MRLEAVTIVKNEADIIEPFVRHHLRLLDHLWVIDNASTDRTLEILRLLRDEGLPLRVTEEPRSPHPQAEVMSEIVSGWTGDCDWLFLIDADEFIDAPARQALVNLLADLDTGSCHLVPWSFMVPTPGDDDAQADPLRRIVHRRDAVTPSYLAKVVLPSALLGRPDVRVGPGNHLLQTDVPHRALEGLSLAHFPIRSLEQLARKAVIGAWATAGQAHRNPGASHHWRLLRDAVLGGEGLTARDLQRAAANYAEPPPWDDWPLVRAPIALPPEQPLRYLGPEPGWQEYAITYADAHFRRLDTQILDEPLVVKTARGPVASPPGPVADLLRQHGDWAPDLVELVFCLTEPGDTVVQTAPGMGYATLGLAEAADLVVVPDRDENWLRTNLVLNGRSGVRLDPQPAAADVLVGPTADVPFRRMLLLDDEGVVPAGHRGLPVAIRQEPYRNHLTGAAVASELPAIPGLIVLRPDDPLWEDLEPYLKVRRDRPGHRWEAQRVIETLILRRRMRRYKKDQQHERPLTDLDRRLLLEQQLQADPVVEDALVSGRVQEVHDRIREFQPDVGENAIPQLELQLRHDVVGRGLHVQGPGGGPAEPPVTRIPEAVVDLTGPPCPLRALVEFEPLSRRFRKTAPERRNLCDHPGAALVVMAALRRAKVVDWAQQHLGGPVVFTLETSGADPSTADRGVGLAFAADGALTVLAAGQWPDQGTVLTVWLFSVGDVPAGQAAILV